MLRVDINLLFNVVNILMLCALVRLFLFKPVNKILAERQAKIDASIAEAESAKTEALELERRHMESMRGIEEEKLAVLTEAQKKAAEEYALILDDAKRKAGLIIRNAEAEGQNRKSEIIMQAKDEIKEIIVAAAAVVAGVGGDSALYDEFIEKAGGADGENSD